mgnify:CR=1 FL=1
MFSYNEETVNDIKTRNPSLENDFITQAAGRPVMAIGCTLLGPTRLIPFDKYNRTYNILEMKFNELTVILKRLYKEFIKNTLKKTKIKSFINNKNEKIDLPEKKNIIELLKRTDIDNKKIYKTKTNETINI